VKALTWFLAVVGLAVALVLAIKTNVGYVQIIYPPNRIDFSLNFLIIMLIAAFSLFYGVVRVVVHTWRLPSYVRHFRRERRREKARRATLGAMLAFAEGRYAKAERLAAQALNSDDSPLINALLAARAAHEQRNFRARDEYLARAERLSPDDGIARLMTQVDLLLDGREVQQALPLLKQLKELAPKHAGVLRLDLKAQQQAKNWDQVLATLVQLEKREAIEPPQAEQLRINAHIENLKRKGHVAEALTEYWEKMPSADQVNGKIALTAAKLFLGLGGTKQAREVIEQSLDKQWDGALVELYGQCADRDVVKQIERAENWLKSHSKDPALLLALGRLCARQELWGKAQSYIEASLSVESTREAHLAAAQLLEKMNKADEACKHYRQSLALESAG
jgi:HemY protein